VRPWIALVFVVGAGLSLLAATETQRRNDRLTRQALNVELSETADAVVRRMHLYQYGLRGLRGAIQAVDGQQLSLEGFQRYQQTRDATREFPGSRGFGFIRRVAEAEQAAFVQQQRRQGQPEYTVHQFQPHAGERFLVQFVWPMALNKAGVGLDIASDPERQSAALAALRSGDVQLSRPIVFFDSSDRSTKAFLMLLPIYRSAVTPADVDERQATAIGWSYAALQIDEVLENLGIYNEGLGLQLFDLGKGHSSTPFYDRSGGADNPQSLISNELTREIFGRQWRLKLTAYPSFVATLNHTAPQQVLLLGLLISGLITALLAMLDSSRRRRIEIFSDQARLAAIVESSSDGIIGKDLTGMITSWNKGAELIFGFTSEQAVGRRLAELLVPSNLRDQEQDILARINRGERVTHFETQRLHRDGHLVEVSVSVAPIRDGTGVIIGASKTVRDISQQKSAEASLQALYAELETQVAERTAELQQAKLQADSANAAKSAFLANMSHEIRTPLNAVLGMLQLLLHTVLNPRQSDYVNKARSAATSLLGLLNDILDFSKIEAGKLQLDVHRFELERLMRDLAVVLSGNQGDKEVEVVFDLSPNLPGVLFGDSQRLQQILINLAGNALKFTPKGYVIVSITELESNDTEALLRIAVTDTGIGIAQPQQAYIFEGFAQAETSTSRRFGGSGLGLVICKRLVELMGGQLQVISEPGKGSRFWFDLAFTVEPGITLKGACQGIAPSLRILIADDNRVAAELMQQTVVALGWHADLVANGRQAVERVRQAQHEDQPYDVVLMDWRMPELDGLGAAQLIHDNTELRHQPVILMITAYGREALAHIQETMQSPFVEFLTKPITPQQLALSVHQALDGSADSSTGGASQHSSHVRLQGLRLLVVEDNALNRQVAAELLSHEGAQVQLAEGGLQGVRMALAATPPFDAIIMDVQMPDIDGYEATRRIRAEPGLARVPILAMTANASEADRQLCLAAGMNEHVGKPVDINEVVRALMQITGRDSAPPPLGNAAGPVPSSDQTMEEGSSILSRFGMNIELVQRLLQEFQRDAHVLLADLQRHSEQHNRSAQAFVLHALKGSAATIGALALSQRAASLEAQFKTHPDTAAAALADPQTLAELHSLLGASIARLEHWIEGVTDPSAGTGRAKSPITAQQWQAKRMELLELLSTGNMRALELTEELASAEAPEWFGRVVEQVNALMFNAAAQLLREAQ
jgi:PAS domain S-box-containing protein